MWNFHGLEIFTFERTFSFMHICSIIVHHQWWNIWLIIREHFVRLDTQRGTVFVLRLLLTTDTHQQIQQILIWGNELPKCICHRDICCLSVVWKPALTGVCAVPVLEAQKNSVRKGPWVMLLSTPRVLNSETTGEL